MLTTIPALVNQMVIVSLNASPHVGFLVETDTMFNIFDFSAY